MTVTSTVAFRHVPAGISVLSLRAGSTLWLANHVQVPKIEELHSALTTGNLREAGGREVMKLMHDRLSGTGVRLDGRQLVVAWLLAVQTDKYWAGTEIEMIAQSILRGNIRVRDYLPLPQLQDAD